MNERFLNPNFRNAFETSREHHGIIEHRHRKKRYGKKTRRMHVDFESGVSYKEPRDKGRNNPPKIMLHFDCTLPRKDIWCARCFRSFRVTFNFLLCNYRTRYFPCEIEQIIAHKLYDLFKHNDCFKMRG